MTDKKPQPPHLTAIQQILAQFDIETQVRKFTLQTMDSYMLGYPILLCAFEYVRQWEGKFVEFEARLVKAESYYRGMEVSVNAKVQVTNSLNQRLERFSGQFYEAIKQSHQSLQQMRKNYTNLVKQTGTQAGSIRHLQRQLKDLTLHQTKLQTQFTHQTTTLTQKLTQTDQQITLKNSQRIQDHQKLLIKFSQAKAELDSKQSVLTSLCQDMGLYQNDKVGLEGQIKALYEELGARVLVTEFNRLRVYVDGEVVGVRGRVEEVGQLLSGRIQEERDARVSVNKQIMDKIRANHAQVQGKIASIQQQITTNRQQITTRVSTLQQTTTTHQQTTLQTLTQTNKRITSCEQQNELTQSKTEQLSNSTTQTLELFKIQIAELVSNIKSINELIGKIERENGDREQELAKLKVQTESKGDVGERVGKLAERVLAHDEGIRRGEERMGDIAARVQLNHSTYLTSIQSLTQKTITDYTTLSTTQQSTHTALQSQLTTIHTALQSQIEQKHQSALQTFQTEIKQKILSIRDKFEFLNNVSSDMEVFKRTFAEQLDMNDALNREVKEKMDRMFGMITKLKTDAFIKIQALGQDHVKSAGKIKENTKMLGDICSVLSMYNQTLTILLSLQFSKQFTQDKQPPQQYKLSSLIEGWVLELTKQRTKYRGEQASRRALFQLFLENHVKNGDKLKGGLLESGKDVFARVVGGSQEYQQGRRRSVSRRKQQRMSELPKVYR